jgi:anti-sigma B factor antagonist
MELMYEHNGSVMIISLVEAQLDASTAAEFKHNVAPVLEEHSQVVFDLSRLAFIDSSGLGALLACLRQLHARGGDLKLCGVTKPVRALF